MPKKRQQAETSEPKSNNGLDEIAVQVRAILKRKTKDKVLLGELLQRAADRSEYGQYKEWLEREFDDMPDDTAMNYRDLYRLTTNPNGSGLLGLRIPDRALYRLGALLKDEDRHDQEEIFKQVKEAAEKGRVTLDTVRNIINPPVCSECGRTEDELPDDHALRESITVAGTVTFVCTECTERKADEYERQHKLGKYADNADESAEPAPADTTKPDKPFFGRSQE